MSVNDFYNDHKNIFWVFGPAAAGKSTFVKKLRKLFLKKGQSVFCLSDLEKIIDLLKKDSLFRFHEKIGNDQFIIKDSFIYDQSIVEICRTLLIEKNKNKHDYYIIEVSCGFDEQQEFDLSLERRLELIESSLFKLSKFFYIKNSLSRRRRLNLKRKKVVKTPENIFNRLFVKDDFEKIEKSNCLDFCILENMKTKESFNRRIQNTFQL